MWFSDSEPAVSKFLRPSNYTTIPRGHCAPRASSGRLVAGSGCQETARKLRPFPDLVLPSSHSTVWTTRNDRKGSQKALTFLSNLLICSRFLQIFKDANNKLNTLQPRHLPKQTNSQEKYALNIAKSLDCERRLTLQILACPATRPPLGVGALPAGNGSPCW